MTIERACERSAAPAGEQKFAAVSTAMRAPVSRRSDGLPRGLEQVEAVRSGRIERIGNVEVAAGIKVIGSMRKRKSLWIVD
jgi:hypothetical protein